MLAASQMFCAHMGWVDMASVAPIAENAALAAIRADGEDPWAHLALACVHLFARRLDDSLAEFELALRLNPNFSLAQGYYGLALSYCGRWQEAAQAASRALRLSRVIRFWRSIMASPLMRSSSDATTTRRCGWRARACASAPISLARTPSSRRLPEMAGQAEVATGALQELRRAQPNISLAWIASQMPIKLDAEREHYLEGFRRAGLD